MTSSYPSNPADPNETQTRPCRHKLVAPGQHHRTLTARRHCLAGTAASATLVDLTAVLTGRRDRVSIFGVIDVNELEARALGVVRTVEDELMEEAADWWAEMSSGCRYLSPFSTLSRSGSIYPPSLNEDVKPVQNRQSRDDRPSLRHGERRRMYWLTIPTGAYLTISG
jgi:hypothetical protein